MIEFSHVEAPDENILKEALAIYSDSFPLNEQQPLELLRHRIQTGLNRLYIGRSNQEIVFVALVWPLINTNFILLDYMATKSSFRGTNIGSAFLKEMSHRLKADKQYFIMEVENPLFGSNGEQRQRRVSFYKKNGAKEIAGFRYLLPALHGDEPTEMILLIFPDYPGGQIPLVVLKKVVAQIYLELYGRNETDPFIQSILLDNTTTYNLT